MEGNKDETELLCGFRTFSQSSVGDQDWRKALYRVTKNLNKCLANDQLHRRLKLLAYGTGDLEEKLADLEQIISLYRTHINIANGGGKCGGHTSTPRLTYDTAGVGSASLKQRRKCDNCSHLERANKDLLSELESNIKAQNDRMQDLDISRREVRSSTELPSDAYELLATAKQNLKTIETMRKQSAEASKHIETLNETIRLQVDEKKELLDIKSKLEVCWVVGEEHVRALERELTERARQVSEHEEQCNALAEQNVAYKNNITYLKTVIRWQNESIAKNDSIVKILCRVKPIMRPRGVATADSLVPLKYPHKNVVEVNGSHSVFDSVFRDASASGDNLFNELWHSVRGALYGINACIICYGTSGSGRTQTLLGCAPAADEYTSATTSRGIIEEAVQALLTYNHHEATEHEYRVRLSIAQVHNDHVYDVVDFTREPLALRPRAGGGGGHVEIVGLSSTVICTIEDFKACMRKKDYNLAEYALYHDSGSKGNRDYHQVYFICIEKRRRGQPPKNDADEESPWAFKKVGEIAFVNCATLQVQKQHSNPEKVTAKSLQTTMNSTNELSALENVLRALKQRERHVPYRSSKLTFVLQQLLTAQCSVSIVVHVNPAPPAMNSFEESGIAAAAENVEKTLQISNRLRG